MENNFDNYFIMDKAWADSGTDEFGHLDIATVLENLLRKHSAPFNIALIGGWGLGKSTTLNFLEEKFKSEEQNFKFITINAWKYEKEALRRMFLIKAYEQLTGRKEISEEKRLRKWLYSVNEKKFNIAAENNNTFLKKILYFLRLFVESSIILILQSIILTFILSVGLKIIEFLPFFNGTFSQINDFYLFLFTFMLTTVYSLSKEALNKITAKPLDGVEINFPIKSTEEFENKLIANIQNRGKDFKLICIIDDIDRLNTTKMVEALDAIKSFVDVKQCIFIVPFDQDIIKDALKKSKKTNSVDGADMIESELILDKLFQFKIYVPELVAKDYIPYALTLCKSENFNLNKKCNLLEENFFENEIIPILIHYYVKTPRQVKKLINAFAFNLHILFSRCQKKRFILEPNKENIISLAILSVLQTDFNEFYCKLLEFPSLINDFINFQQNIETEKGHTDIERNIYSFYEKLCKTKVVNMQSLMHFLNRNHYKLIENFEPLLYLASSRNDVAMGGKVAQDFFALLASGNKEAANYIDHLTSPYDAVKNELTYNFESEITNYNYIVSLLKIFEHFGTDKLKILDLVSSHISNKYDNFLNSQETNILSISEITNVLLFSKQTIFLDLLKLKLEQTDISFADYDFILENYHSLSNNIKALISKKALTKQKIIYEDELEPIDGYIAIDYMENLTSDKLHLAYTYHVNDDVLKYYFDILADATELTENDVLFLKGIIEKYLQNQKWDQLIEIITPALQNNIWLDFFTANLLTQNGKYPSVIEGKTTEQGRLSPNSEKLIVTAFSKITLNKENATIIDDILCTFIFSTSEEYIEETDMLLENIYKYRYLIELFDNKNILKNIPHYMKFINAFNKEIFTNNFNIQLVETLSPYYSDEQINEFFSLVESKCSVGEVKETTAIDNIVTCIPILAEYPNFKKILTTLLTNVSSSFRSYWNSYLPWSNIIVSVISTGLGLISSLESGAYLNSLLSIYQTHPDISFKGWRYTNCDIPDEIKGQIVDLLFNHNYDSSDDDFYYSAKNFIAPYTSKDAPEDALETYSKVVLQEWYEEFLLDYIQNPILVSDVLGELHSLEKIKNLVSLFQFSQEFKEENKSLSKEILLKSLQQDGDYVSFARDTLSNIETDIDWLDDILVSLENTTAIESIKKLLIEDLFKKEYSYLYNLAKLIVPYKQRCKSKDLRAFVANLLHSLTLKFSNGTDNNIVELCVILGNFKSIGLTQKEKSSIFETLNNINKIISDISDEDRRLLLDTIDIFENKKRIMRTSSKLK